MDIWQPFDLENIRRNLRHDELTLEAMGYLIKAYVPTCKYKRSVPKERVWEWEKGETRSVPKYVFYAYGAVLIDDWASNRHAVDLLHLPEMDGFYANLLNPGYGQIVKTEHQIRQSGDPGQLALLADLAAMREGWEKHFKDLLGLDMRHVWVEKLEDLFS